MQEGRQQLASAQLKAVERRVERWRSRGGGKGTRMPEDLWQAAAEVARVEYSRLKQRVTSTVATSRKSSSFVELGMSELCGACSKTVVEICGSEGDRMRVEVIGTPTVDLVGLTQTFLGQRS